jgi:hypothetical protein
MKIFISWSGKHSLQVATNLREWLPYIFNGIELFVSSEDIRKGKRWPLEVSKELDACNFGIVCLTPDNLDAPWLLFESGALSKSVKEASVFTLLVGGLRISDIEGPLSHFQHTLFEKEDFFKLISAINDKQEIHKQDAVRLRKIFEKFWDELEASVAKLINAETKPEKKRSTDEMLHELLEVTGYIARNMGTDPEPETNKLPTDQAALWTQVIEKVGRVSPFTRSYLVDAVGGMLSKNTFTILFSSEFADHLGLVDNKRNHTLIQKVLSELGQGDNCKVVFKLWGEPQSPPTKK